MTLLIKFFFRLILLISQKEQKIQEKKRVQYFLNKVVSMLLLIGIVMVIDR